MSSECEETRLVGAGRKGGGVLFGQRGKTHTQVYLWGGVSAEKFTYGKGEKKRLHPNATVVSIFLNADPLGAVQARDKESWLACLSAR